MPTTVSFNRMDLLSRLEQIKAGTSNKDLMEQTSCVVFKGGKLVTFNDEVSCRLPSRFPKDFECAVKYTPLVALLTKMQEEELKAELSDSEFVVTGKNRKSGIFMEKNIQLGFSAVESPKEWVEVPSDFAEAITIVSAVAGKDESKFVSTCVNVAKEWIEATDNHQICRYFIKTGITKSSLIRKEAVKTLGSLEVTQFSETEKWLHFRNEEGFIYSARRYQEEFLDVSPFLKKEGAEVQLPKSLAEAAERANIFSSENADDNLVSVKLSEGRVIIEGRGSSGWYKEAKKAEYKDEPLHFLISPEILSEVLRKMNRCLITDRRLLINGGKWTYCTSLSVPEKETKDD